MQNYIILTDSGSDLTDELKRELDIAQMELTIIVEGEEPKPDNDEGVCYDQFVLLAKLC